MTRSARRRGFGDRDLLRLVDRAADVVFRYRIEPPGFEFVSLAIARITGFTPEELYADPELVRKLVHHDDRPIVDEVLERGIGRVPIVLRWIRKDGSVVWMEQRTTPIFSRARELVAVEAVARETTDPTQGVRPQVRVVGDLRIDFNRGRVFVGGSEVHLTPSELRMLVLLTDEPGRVISRATMMEALWNSTRADGGRACEVHVSKLRAKIGRDGRRALIETVRGQGYRFTLSG